MTEHCCIPFFCCWSLIICLTYCESRSNVFKAIGVQVVIRTLFRHPEHFAFQPQFEIQQLLLSWAKWKGRHRSTTCTCSSILCHWLAFACNYCRRWQSPVVQLSTLRTGRGSHAAVSGNSRVSPVNPTERPLQNLLTFVSSTRTNYKNYPTVFLTFSNFFPKLARTRRTVNFRNKQTNIIFIQLKTRVKRVSREWTGLPIKLIASLDEDGVRARRGASEILTYQTEELYPEELYQHVCR